MLPNIVVDACHISATWFIIHIDLLFVKHFFLFFTGKFLLFSEGIFYPKNNNFSLPPVCPFEQTAPSSEGAISGLLFFQFLNLCHQVFQQILHSPLGQNLGQIKAGSAIAFDEQRAVRGDGYIPAHKVDLVIYQRSF